MARVAALLFASSLLFACAGNQAANLDSETVVTPTPIAVPVTTTLRQTVTQFATVTVTPTSATPVAPAAVEVGTKTLNGGIEITVTAITNVPSYTTVYNRDENVIEPRAGGKLIQVQAVVLNNTNSSIDLTCGYPVAAKLVDTESREFDPVDELYKLPNNPTCNYQLQPGFDSPMLWVYEVPIAAKIHLFAFRDTDVKSSNTGNPKWALTNAPADL